MLELLMPLVLLGGLSPAPLSPNNGLGQPLATQALELASAPKAETTTRSHMRRRAGDSLTNGTVIGAVVGGVTGALLAATGCAAGGVLSMNPDAGCGGTQLTFALIGAGIGALVGRGIDALLEQSPYAPHGTSGWRKGVRLKWQFE